MKNCYPIQTAEYSQQAKLSNEPAFAWWIPFTLKKRERIVAAVNSCYHKRTHNLVFDVKMEDLRFKARMVANGNETGAST